MTASFEDKPERDEEWRLLVFYEQRNAFFQAASCLSGAREAAPSCAPKPVRRLEVLRGVFAGEAAEAHRGAQADACHDDGYSTKKRWPMVLPAT